MRETSRQEVEILLEKIRCSLDALDSEYEFIIRKTTKTRKFCTNYGIFLSEIKDEIKAFTIENYCQGPELDHDGYRGHIWVFGCSFRNAEMYVKIRECDNMFICFSVHLSNRPMNYPFK